MIFRKALPIILMMMFAAGSSVAQDISNPPTISSISGLGSGVAALLAGTASGTGGPAGTATPHFSGTPFIGTIALADDGNNTLFLTTNKNIGVLGTGTFIASYDTSLSDGVAIKSDFTNTVVIQGENSSGTAGLDTNLTIYRPSATNDAFIGVTMSATPGAEQHLYLGTNYAKPGYIFGQVITGTGAYLPVQINGGNTDAATLDIAGHVLFDNHVRGDSSAAAMAAGTVSACGTSPSGSGTNDLRGVIAVGSGTATSCTYSFHVAYTSNPICVITGLGTGTNVLYLSALTSSGFTVTSSGNMAGQFISYMCMQ